MNCNLSHRDYADTENGDWNKTPEYKYVSYDEKNDCIVINVRNGLTEYDVSLKRCQTAGECLDWIHQLHVKTWFHAEMEKEFIDLLLKLIPVELWSGGGK